MLGKTRLLFALAGSIAIFAACSADAPTGDTSSANAGDTAPIVDHDGAARSRGAWHHGGARHDATCAPTFTMCSDGQIAAILDSVTGHGWEWTTPALEGFRARLRTDWGPLRAELASWAAREGITPVENAYTRAIRRRGDDLHSGGTWAGPMRYFLAHEVLLAAQNLALIDHLLLPSVKSEELRALIAEARATTADELPLILATEQAEAGGACGDEGGITGPIPCVHGRACSSPGFAACTGRQIGPVLGPIDVSAARIESWVRRYAVDPRVLALLRRMAHPTGAAPAVAAAAPPLAIVGENAIGFIEERTAQGERTYLSYLDFPTPRVDAAFLQYELLEMLTGIGMIDHLLMPSAPDVATRASLESTRARFVAHLEELVALDDELEGPCGGRANAATDAGADAAIDAGADATADASCATDPPAP